MALLNFPSAPNTNDSYTDNGNTWKWNGTSWVAFNNLSLSSQVSGILAVQYGGTGFGGTYTKGDILYATSSNTFGKLAAGTANSVLSINGSGDLFWKLDAQGVGSVSTGVAGEMTYYDSTTSVTSASGITYSAGTSLKIGLTTVSTSTTTGGLVVYGGVGIGGSLNTATGNTSNISGVAHYNSTITSGSWNANVISLTYGGTNNNISGLGHSYRVAMFDAAGTAITNITSGTASSILFQTNQSVSPTWVGQNTLVVGGASTAANIQGGGAGQLVYNSAANTTTFLAHPGAGYALTSVGTGTSVAWQLISSLSAGTASTSTSVITVDGSSSNIYLVGNINTSAGTTQLRQGGTSVYVNGATVTATNFSGLASSSTNVGITTSVGAGTSYLYFGSVASGYGAIGATTSITVTASTGTITANTFSGTATSAQKANNIIGGSASGQSIHIQTGVDTTSFLNTPSSAGQALTSTASGTLAFGPLSSLTVTSLSAGNGIQVSAATGGVTVSNIGVTSITGTANRISVTSSLGSSNGAITLTTPQDIATNSTVTFDTVTVRAGTLTTTSFNSATDIVNKQYVDNLASGLDIHGSVRVIINSAIGASYYQPGYGIGTTAIGSYLTSIGNSDLSARTFDGITLALNQRVLVTAGLTATGKTSINGSALVTPSNSNVVNGIYYVGSVGSGSSQWYLYRATDTDESTELTGGTFTFVEEGTTYADSGWVCANDTTNNGPIQFGSTVITFTQFAGATAFNVGQGLTKVGNTIATNANISPTGVASGTGYTQFNIGGPSVGGVADTGYYPTFSVRTSGNTVAGTAILTLNSDGFSLIGSTNTNRTVTITGSDITLTGGGNTLTLTGSISLPAPTQYSLAFGTSATALGFLTAGTANSVLFQTNNTTNPSWVGQNTLVVGGATTAANIQGGSQYNVIYQSNANTTGFVGNAAGGGASVLTQVTGSAPVYIPQSQMIVGGASTVANIQGGSQYNLVYQSNANTTGFIGNAAGSGASILTQSGSALPAYLGQSQLVVGGASTAANIQGGSLGNIHYQTGSNATGFVTNAAGSGASILTQTGSAAPVFLGQSQLVVGGASTAANIQGGGAGSLVYNSGANTTAFLSNSGTAGSVLVTVGTSGIAWTNSGSLSVGSATNSTNTTNVNVTSTNGTGTSYLAFVSGTSGNLPILIDSNITVNANTNTIAADNFSGLATSSTRVGIGTNVTNSDLPIVFSDVHQPYAALGSSTLLTYNPSNGKITNGVWAGTAITTGRGGTGLNTVSANQLLIGASTGNTWAAIGSSLAPVVNVGANPPANPGGAIGNTQPGQLWWDSTYGVLKIYYADADTSQWVDATPVLGSSGGGSSTKRSYVMTFGSGFTPSTGADTVQILVPYAPDNSSKYYYIKRLDFRNETVSTGAGVSFYIDRHTSGNASFTVANRIHSGSGLSFVVGAGIYITSYTLSSTGASFVSSAGVAGSIISGDYLRLNFTALNSSATLSVSMVIEEQ